MEKSAFAEMLAELRQDAAEACWSLGYMKAIVDEPLIGEKTDASYSGYAMVIATTAVKRMLSLYCSRAWDQVSDVSSIPNLIKLLPSFQELTRERKSWHPDPAFDHQVDALSAEHSKLLADVNAVDKKRIASLRVFRTEWLAHRVKESKDRMHAEKAGPLEDTTVRNLLDFAEHTVSTVGRLGLVWDGTNSAYLESIDRAERYCREFWRVIPNLGDVEDAGIG